MQFKKVPGHNEDVPFFLTEEMFGGVGIEIAGGAIHNLIDKPVAEPHKHDCPEVYFLVSPSPAGAEIEIKIENQPSVTLTSPGVFHIPAGVSHQFITKKAEFGSFCFGVFLTHQREKK